MEKEMLRRIKQQGLDIIPRILIVSGSLINITFFYEITSFCVLCYFFLMLVFAVLRR